LIAKRILFFPAMVEVLADGLMHQDCAPSGAARFALDHIKETRQFESVSEIRMLDQKTLFRNLSSIPRVGVSQDNYQTCRSHAYQAVSAHFDCPTVIEALVPDQHAQDQRGKKLQGNYDIDCQFRARPINSPSPLR
jgi:hypothetical protein